MQRYQVIWAGLTAGIAVAEMVALKKKIPGATLSETTRLVFQVHHPIGRTAFSITWIAFAAWFHRHIRTNPGAEDACPVAP